jgi:transposase
VSKLVFSDESWLCCNENTGKIQWCKRGEKPLPREKKARWNVPSVMVWGAIGKGFKSKLVILPSKREDDDGEVKVFRLDSESYVRRCLSTVSNRLVSEGRIFQQDGARSHIAKRTRAYLRRKKINWIEDWPPYSPDLNMIEPVWKELARGVGALCPLTTQELVAAAEKVWNEMPQRILDAHAMHFSRAIQKV